MSSRLVLRPSLVVVAIFLIFQAFDALGADFVLPSGVRVKIVEAPVEKTSAAIVGCSERDIACLINGHVPFGTDSSQPKTYVKSITISYRGQSYLLDVTDMYDAWGSRSLQEKDSARYFGGKCFDEKNCQLRGVFSDAAGSFVAEWRIVAGVPVRTVLTNSNDVVNLFISHIDPPEFD